LQSQGTTYRLTTSPLITVDVNVGDYIQALWDKDNDGRSDTPLELLVTFVDSPPSLFFNAQSIKTAEPNTVEVKLLPEDVVINEQGHMTINLQNPEEEPVTIDLIALGLSRVP
jgi:hypothetical protein